MERQADQKYPYAHEQTYEFLKGALAEGLHHAIPGRMSEANWIRNRNITGVYFSCRTTVDELSQMYGITRQRVSQIIKNTVTSFWENSTVYDRVRFPIKSLSFENPSRQASGLSKTDHIYLEAAVREGLTDYEINRTHGIDINTARWTLRKYERREQITSRRQQIKNGLKRLDDLPVEEYEHRQTVVDELLEPLNTHADFGGNFVSFISTAKLIGLNTSTSPYSNLDNVVSEAKSMGIPVGMVVKEIAGKKIRQFYVHKKDYESLKMKYEFTIPS